MRANRPSITPRVIVLRLWTADLIDFGSGDRRLGLCKRLGRFIIEKVNSQKIVKYRCEHYRHKLIDMGRKIINSIFSASQYVSNNNFPQSRHELTIFFSLFAGDIQNYLSVRLFSIRKRRPFKINCGDRVKSTPLSANRACIWKLTQKLNEQTSLYFGIISHFTAVAPQT